MLPVVAESDRVPTTARLLSSSDLQIDESLLTGESVPVQEAFSLEEIRESARTGVNDQRIICVIAGTIVLQGISLAVPPVRSLFAFSRMTTTDFLRVPWSA
jgi:P-type Ca2+ transporter type 2C